MQHFEQFNIFPREFGEKLLFVNLGAKSISDLSSVGTISSYKLISLKTDRKLTF